MAKSKFKHIMSFNGKSVSDFEARKILDELSILVQEKLTEEQWDDLRKWQAQYGDNLLNYAAQSPTAPCHNNTKLTNQEFETQKRVQDTNLALVLIAKGFDVNNRTAQSGFSPLYWACKNENVPLVKALVNKRADPFILPNDWSYSNYGVGNGFYHKHGNNREILGLLEKAYENCGKPSSLIYEARTVSPEWRQPVEPLFYFY